MILIFTFSGGDRIMFLSKTISKKFLLATACSCLVVSTLIALPFNFFASSAQAQSRKVRYIPPSNLDAPKVSASGITRSAGCVDTTCFIALIPDLQVDNRPAPLTISERPTIYLLAPKIKKGKARFTLNEVDDKLQKTTRVYRTTYIFQNEAGVVSLKLPEDAPALKPNKNYTWDIILTEDDFSFAETVRGSVRRIEPRPKLLQELETAKNPLEKATLLAQEGIWFESLQALIEAQTDSPTNLEAKNEWTDLLKSVKLDRVIGQPLQTCCQVKPKNPLSVDLKSY
jgi:hypothetical protein